MQPEQRSRLGSLVRIVGLLNSNARRTAATILLTVLMLGSGTAAFGAASGPTRHALTTVFLVIMENHNWSQIAANPSAPYINRTLPPRASYATAYYNPPGPHPSLPNYLWLEAGTNFGIRDDAGPAAHSIASSRHLVTLLDRAGITWKAWVGGISGTTCPLTSAYPYAAKHNPPVYFDDVTNHNDPRSTYCITHERPLGDLAADLARGTVPRYNLLIPDLCDDMHDACAPTNDPVRQGDAWLSDHIPGILHSAAYQRGGVLFITWDEGAGGDGPIGLLILSPDAKGHGYHNAMHLTHSATLRTVEEIFGVRPLLGGAATSPDLRSFFTQFP